MISTKVKLKKAKTVKDRRKIVEDYLKEQQKYVNRSLSHQTAEGNVAFLLASKDWSVRASGQVCSGVDASGAPFWRQADELFEGDHRWSANSPFELIELISRAIERANRSVDTA